MVSVKLLNRCNVENITLRRAAYTLVAALSPEKDYRRINVGASGQDPSQTFFSFQMSDY